LGKVEITPDDWPMLDYVRAMNFPKMGEWIHNTANRIPPLENSEIFPGSS